MVEIDRKKFLESAGGTEAVAAMSPEARTDALEDFLATELGPGPKGYPTVADVENQIETRSFRRGAGALFYSEGENVKKLAALPAKPTLADMFQLRFSGTANHCLQSANLAMKKGAPEEVILACLLHDTVQALIKVDHGWWSAQLYEPYVSEKVAFAIRYHQALRFYEDKEAGYLYPELYRSLFGEDYKPEPYIEEAYRYVRNHKWYDLPRLVTVNDLYAFEKNVDPEFEQFTDVIGRHFKQPKEGLGFDNSPVAHMWRSIIMPDRPL